MENLLYVIVPMIGVPVLGVIGLLIYKRMRHK